MTKLSLRSAAVPLGLAALLLAGCSAASPGGSTAPTDPAAETETETETVAPTVETACPAGFLDAYTAASVGGFLEGVTFTEVSAADFEPAFLAKFLDGGCAIHVAGTATFNGMEFPVDDDFGFTPEPIANDIIAALEDEGYEDDGSGINFTNDDTFAGGGVYPIGGDVHTTGDSALLQYYSGGVAFSG